MYPRVGRLVVLTPAARGNGEERLRVPKSGTLQAGAVPERRENMSTVAFVSWSGGKDCCLAFHKGVKAGMKVTHLLNCITLDGSRSRSHGVPAGVLEAQAAALGAAIVQPRVTWGTYEEGFRKAAAELGAAGIKDGIFGDIDLQEHRDWVERVCGEAGIVPHLPLWGMDHEQVVTEFLGAGFEAVVVSVKAGVVPEEWLGRRLDAGLVADLVRKGVSPCGEAGEYHTLVTGGPLFRQRLTIGATRKAERDGYWFLDILDYGLADL